MDKTRLWMIGSTLAMVVVAVLGWMLAIQPQLDQAAEADAQKAQVDAGNTANQLALDKLKKDSAELPALKSQLDIVSKSIPAEAETPGFMDELTTLATANGLTITASQITNGKGFVPPDNPAAPTASSTTSGNGASATATPTPSPTPSATSAPTLKPATVPGMPPAVSSNITASDLTVIPVSVTVRGPYPNIVAFVAAAQKGERLFMVNGVNVDPAANGPGFDGKVSGLIYVLSAAAEAAPAK